LTHTHSQFDSRYRQTAVSTGNTFRDLAQLRETAENIKRYILRDIM